MKMKVQKETIYILYFEGRERFGGRGIGLAVDCYTLVHLQRQTHGLQLMRDGLVVPRDRRSTLNKADDVRYCRAEYSRNLSTLSRGLVISPTAVARTATRDDFLH